MPVVSFDYMFVTNGRVLRREELDKVGEDSVDLKILVVKASKSKTMFAHVVDKEGTDASGYAVTRVVEDLSWLGRTKVTLKADNERAIVKLLKEALRAAKRPLLRSAPKGPRLREGLRGARAPPRETQGSGVRGAPRGGGGPVATAPASTRLSV